jgi:hypothetical protein
MGKTIHDYALIRVMSKLRILLSAVAVLSIATAFVLEHRAQRRERERNEALREEIERLSRSQAQTHPPARLVLHSNLVSTLPGDQWRELLRLRGELGVLRQEKFEVVKLQADNARLRSNWIEQLASGKKLSHRQIAPFLQAKQRNAESLIAAAQATGDLDLLREALEKYPHDPRVNFTACFAFKDKVLPGERRQRLDALKQSAPDNALANYLSAQDYLKSGQTDQAVQELVAASGKPLFQDYYSGFVQNIEDAYRAAGFSTLESVTLAYGQPLPHLAELKGLGDNLTKLANLYRQAGDDASANAALQMGVALGRQVSQPSGQSPIIAEFVGTAIERQILAALDPASPYDGSGRSVKDRLSELSQQREDRGKLVKSGQNLLSKLSESDLIGYYDRLKASGELEAMRWVMSRQTKP